MSLLDNAVAHAERRVERLKREMPLERLRELPLYSRKPQGLAALLAAKSPRRVAEIRFASPEVGFRVPRGQATAAEAARWARAAADAGAAAISVVVERHFHAGDWSHVAAVREALPDAVLIARDFTLDEHQLELARAHGADGVALWGAVSGARTAALADAARALGLGVVAEARNVPQLELAREARPDALLASAVDLEAVRVDPDGARLVVNRARELPVFLEVATAEALAAARGEDVWAAADLG